METLGVGRVQTTGRRTDTVRRREMEWVKEKGRKKRIGMNRGPVKHGNIGHSRPSRLIFIFTSSAQKYTIGIRTNRKGVAAPPP